MGVLILLGGLVVGVVVLVFEFVSFNGGMVKVGGGDVVGCFILVFFFLLICLVCKLLLLVLLWMVCEVVLICLIFVSDGDEVK